MKMIGKLLGSEGINAAMVVALSGTVIALAAKGGGPVSLKSVASGCCRTRFPGLNLRAGVMRACPSRQVT